MDNALHYVPAGGQVVIGVRWMEHKGKPLLLFFVMDNGPVVPEPLRQAIFEPGFVWNPPSAERTGRSLFKVPRVRGRARRLGLGGVEDAARRARSSCACGRMRRAKSPAAVARRAGASRRLPCPGMKRSRSHAHGVELLPLLGRQHRLDLVVGVVELLVHLRADALGDLLHPLVMAIHDRADLIALLRGQLQLVIEMGQDAVAVTKSPRGLRWRSR